MTELDVEALEAAIDAVRERNMFTLDGAIAQGIREYLDRTSTHPAPQPSGPVEVKPLEWEERVGVDGTFDAYTSIGHYIATITDDDRGMWFAVGLTQSNYCAPDINIAKAAAQADYEQRILSALEAPPAPMVTDEKVDAALAAFESAGRYASTRARIKAALTASEAKQ